MSSGAEAGFLLELPVGCFLQRFARFHSTFHQRQLYLVEARRILADEEQLAGIVDGNDHDRGRAGPGQALVGALLSRGEPEVQLLDAKEAGPRHRAHGFDLWNSHAAPLLSGQKCAR